jgi:hypothetical protein
VESLRDRDTELAGSKIYRMVSQNLERISFQLLATLAACVRRRSQRAALLYCQLGRHSPTSMERRPPAGHVSGPMKHLSQIMGRAMDAGEAP